MIWTSVLAAVIDVLAPARCAGCNAFGRPLCLRCRDLIARTRPVVRRNILGVDRVIALGAFEGELRRSVLALKYANRRDIADDIAAIFVGKVAVLGDMAVPVPLHPSRLERRGYNQAGVLAAALVRHWSAQGHVGALSLSPNALRRVKPTAPQSGLDMDKRRGNVEDAFGPGDDAAHVRGRRIILVDDVVTTGATLQACARVLQASGAARIAAVCAAATP